MQNGTESHAKAEIGIEVTRANGSKEAPAEALREPSAKELATEAGLELVAVGHKLLDVGHVLLNHMARRLAR
jgi:hypothetical protein